MKTKDKPTIVREVPHPRPTVSSGIEGSGQHLRRLSALDERRGRAKEVAPGAAEVLKHRLALPVREVAGLLGISSAAVRLMIVRGEIPGRKIGGGTERVTYIVPTGALLSWLEGSSLSVAAGVA